MNCIIVLYCIILNCIVLYYIRKMSSRVNNFKILLIILNYNIVFFIKVLIIKYLH